MLYVVVAKLNMEDMHFILTCYLGERVLNFLIHLLEQEEDASSIEKVLKLCYKPSANISKYIL